MHNQPTQQEDAEQSQETAYVKPSEHEGKFGIGDKMTFYVDGKPIEAEVVQAEDVDGVVVQTSERVNGHLINQYTREELDALTAPPQQANDNADAARPQATETGAEVQNETEGGKSPDELPAFDGDKFNETHPVDEIRQLQEEQNPKVENNAVDEASTSSKIPQDESGEYDYMQAEPSKAWAALLEQTEGDADMAREVAQSMLNDKVAELEEAQKQQPKEGKSVAEKIAARKEHKANIERIEKEIEQWQQILSQSEQQPTTEETKPKEETPSNHIADVSKKEEETTQQENIKLSDEVDENGRQFVLNSEGNLAFGEITEDTGLTAAPILLSEGMITNRATNDGYGLAHIEARHGEEIRKAGYKSVLDFIEQVAKNYDVIKEGNMRDGRPTYRLMLTDKHNNTLMVELSGDGTFWNINTAGIFKTSYGRKNREVYNRHTTVKQSAETTETSQDAEQSDTQAPSRMNVPTTSESEDTKSKAEGQEKSEESKETSLSEQISTASAEVNTDPTDAQKEAGNYKKGHVQVGTFDITIEQPQGSIRRGKDANGRQWEHKMHNTYGYFRGTEGVDGDHIDVFLSNYIDDWNGRKVFVVDQYNPDGTFDEHKVMLGFNDVDEAKSDYLANYEKGWENGRRIDVTPVNLEDFEKWIGSSHRKTKAFAEYAGVKKEDLSASENGEGKEKVKPQEEQKPKKPTKKKGEESKAEGASAKSADEQADFVVSRVKDFDNGKREETGAGEAMKKESGLSFGNGKAKRSVKFGDFIPDRRSEQQQLRGIHYDNGMAVISDGYRLVAIRTEYPAEYEGRTLMPNGREAKGRFPNWRVVVPNVGIEIGTDWLNRVLGLQLEESDNRLVSFGGKPRATDVMVGELLRLAKLAEKISNPRLFYAQDRLLLTGDGVVCLQMLHNGIENEDVTLRDFLNGNVPSLHRAGESNGELTKAEVALRDAVIDRLRENGIDVVTDVSEGQRVLDMANGKERLSGKQKRALETATIADESTNKATVVSSADGAKVQNNLEILADSYQKLHNRTKGFITDLSRSLGLEQHEASQYGTFVTGNGKTVTIRVSNHNAKVSNFDRNGENDGISIVISSHKNKGLNNDGNAHVTEFFYPRQSLERADGKPLSEIIRSVSEALKNGEFKDTTGLAQRQEVNGDVVREHRVYHGSGADFDSFDHSHMGEGEGAQAYGWGTYVAVREGTAKGYAQRDAEEKNGEKSILKWYGSSSSVEEIMDYLEENYPDTFGEWLYKKWGNTYRVKLKGVLDTIRYGNEYDVETLKDELYHIQNDYNYSDEEKEFYNEVKDKVLPYVSAYKPYAPNLYAVEIPNNNNQNYIEEYKDYGARTKLRRSVEKGLKELGIEGLGRDAMTGRDIYDVLIAKLGSKKKTSKFLEDLGIVGVHYYGMEDGECYVIFNEGDAKIVDKVRFFKTANGEAYGFVVGGKIYIDPRIASSETSVHEYAHLWAEALRSANAKEWSNVVGLMRGTSVWNEVMERYPELKSDDEIADEVLATYSGRRGSERLREEVERIKGSERSVADKARALGALERVRRALDRFWHGVADFLGIHYKSADEVADRVMRDLLNGVDPRRLAQKKVQNDIVQRENPMLDDYHTGIRSEDDIHTFAEAVSEAQREKEKYGDEQMSSYPDITDSLLNEAIKTGKITIYSSKPIKDGVFVTPSRMQAQDYAGGRGAKVYSKEVSIESVAWIDVDEGQFAEVKNAPMDKIRFQYIGEMGAESADRADEVSTRLDNLRVAREMESDNRDAKSIKLATGWERGADGKWRYEIPDLKYFGKGDAGYKKVRGKQPWSKELDGLSDRIFDGEELSAEEQRRFEELAQEEENFKTDYLNREKPHLADWVENDELFKAYPELKRVKLVFSDQLPANVGGSYNEREHTIVVNRNYVGGDTSSVLAHEVQHAIQYIEGFARGGNTDQLERDFDAAKAEWRARSYAHELEEKAKELGGDYDQLGVERALIREYEDMDMLDWLPDKETRIKGFNYFARGYADRSMDDAIRRFRLNESTRSDFNSYLEYQKLGGEVEARNVVKRMGMSADERRASLAEETEDVSREDQIFLRGEGGVQSMSYDYEKYPTGKVEPNLADKEIGIVQAKSNHGFKNFGEAKEWAKNNIARTYDNEETGGKGNIRISNTAIGKFLTQSAVDKSESKDVHLAVLKVLPDVIRESVDAETHPDFNKDDNEIRSAENSVNKNVLMHRLYGAVDIDGKTYRVKVTLKEDKQNENLPKKAYSYEATKIELLTGTLGKPEDDASRANNSITGAKLLKDVGMSYDPTKKLLDESKKNETDTTLFRDEVDGAVSSSSGVDGMRERAVELGADVDVVSDVSEISDPNSEVQERKRRAKGWYDAKTGRVVINLAAHSDMADVEQTLLHEIVGHRGLRGLVGHENFNGFLDRVYEHASDVVREGIDDIARRKGCSKRVATEEYMSGLAEGGFADRKNAGLWRQIRQWFGDMLSRAKIKLNFSISDNELRYLLWRSHELSRMNGREGVVGHARDLAMQNRLGVGNGVRKGGESAVDSYDGDLETLFRDADSPVDYERALIRDSYERRLKDVWFQSREALQDGMLSLKETMKDIWRSAGKKFSQITDIPDYANPYIGQNRLSSRNAAEVRDFKHNLFRPLLREVGRLTGFSADGRAKLTDYMMAKHGLERNKVMAERVAKHPNSLTCGP